MKQLKFALIILIVTIGLCFSCEKDHQVGEFFLTDEMKAQNPYQKGDTLKLISNIGDTLSCYVNSRSNQIHQYLLGINTADYYLIEIENTSIVLKNATENGSFSFQMGGEFANNNRWIIYLHFGEKNNEFSLHVPLSKESTPYIDSLFVMNRWIKEVFIQETALTNKLYYSTEFGVVKIDFSDGSFWELESIKWAERE